MSTLSNCISVTDPAAVTTEDRRMGSALHATSILAASWFVTLVVGLVSSKILAVVLGPTGFGYFGLLQSFVELVTMAGGLGIGTALVRFGADRIACADQFGIARLRQGSWVIFTATGVLTALVLVLFRVPLSGWVLGSSNYGWSIALMAVAVLFTQASYIQVNTLNAYHRVKALARYGVWNKLLGAVMAIALVMIWKQKAIVPAVVAMAVMAWLPARQYFRKEIGVLSLRVGWHDSLEGAKSLLGFGIPYVGSAAFSRGIQLLLPIVVLHLLDAESVGNYRAASTVAVTYLGFLVTAMAQDYFPRVSAQAGSKEALCNLINEQQRLILMLGVPMILGVIALAPYFIPLFYSSKFNNAVEILEWLLIADLFRLSSWTMMHVILARMGSRMFFFTEAFYGLTTLFTSWLGARWFGLAGLGIAFLTSYVAYYYLVWLIVRREIELVWTKSNFRTMIIAAAAALAVRMTPFTPLRDFRMVIALIVAAAASVWSAVALWRELKGHRPNWFGPLGALAKLVQKHT